MKYRELIQHANQAVKVAGKKSIYKYLRNNLVSLFCHSGRRRLLLSSEKWDEEWLTFFIILSPGFASMRKKINF